MLLYVLGSTTAIPFLLVFLRFVSPLQSVLNTAARLIARFPRYSHISTLMFDELHWLPLAARIQFKILTLIFKAQRGLAPQYLIGVILRPHSAPSHRPLRSCNRLDLLVPRTRTSMAQSRSFAAIGPSLWNALSPSVRSTILSSRLSSSFDFLKTCFFSRGLAHWERLWTVHSTRGALQMLKYNTRQNVSKLVWIHLLSVKHCDN